MFALPLKIQDHYFEFLVLIVDSLDEYDFITGLEAAIQLEAVYHMTSHIVNNQPRSVPFEQRYQNFTWNFHLNSIKWRSSLYFYFRFSNYKSTACRTRIFFQYY